MSNPEATAEAIESVSNMSFEELVAQRTARQNPETESEEQTEEEEPESQEEEIPDESEETETEEETGRTTGKGFKTKTKKSNHQSW